MKRAEIVETLYEYLVSEDNADLIYCAEERAPANLAYLGGAIDFARHMVEKAEADDER